MCVCVCVCVCVCKGAGASECGVERRYNRGEAGGMGGSVMCRETVQPRMSATYRGGGGGGEREREMESESICCGVIKKKTGAG